MRFWPNVVDDVVGVYDPKDAMTKILTVANAARSRIWSVVRVAETSCTDGKREKEPVVVQIDQSRSAGAFPGLLLITVLVWRICWVA